LRKGRPISEACRPEQLVLSVRNIFEPVSKNSDAGKGHSVGPCSPSPSIVLVAAADALAAMVSAVAKGAKSSTLKMSLTDSESLVPVIILVLDAVYKVDGENALEVLCRLTKAVAK